MGSMGKFAFLASILGFSLGLAFAAHAADPTPPRSILSVARPAGMPPISFAGAGGHAAHVFPTVNMHAQIKAATPAGQPPSFVNGQLTYNGGPVMGPNLVVYNIFWSPHGTLSTTFQNAMNILANYYPNHSLASNNTQYYSGTSPKIYVNATGGWGGSFVDTQAFPANGCSDPYTTTCMSDSQLQAEIARVMGVKGWTGGLNKIFMIYTEPGVGSCFSGSSTCAYSYFCAYHSYMTVNSANVIYANEPYGDPTYCQIPGVPSPHNDPYIDTTATSASHEITEAVTDPVLNAWYDYAGNEIGDICAYRYGPLNWRSQTANQMWSGNYFLLQQEYDNVINSCVSAGP